MTVSMLIISFWSYNRLPIAHICLYHHLLFLRHLHLLFFFTSFTYVRAPQVALIVANKLLGDVLLLLLKSPTLFLGFGKLLGNHQSDGLL